MKHKIDLLCVNCGSSVLRHHPIDYRSSTSIEIPYDCEECNHEGYAIYEITLGYSPDNFLIITELKFMEVG